MLLHEIYKHVMLFLHVENMLLVGISISDVISVIIYNYLVCESSRDGDLGLL